MPRANSPLPPLSYESPLTLGCSVLPLQAADEARGLLHDPHVLLLILHLKSRANSPHTVMCAGGSCPRCHSVCPRQRATASVHQRLSDKWAGLIPWKRSYVAFTHKVAWPVRHSVELLGAARPQGPTCYALKGSGPTREQWSRARIFSTSSVRLSWGILSQLG